jgi:hypothetical protein
MLGRSWASGRAVSIICSVMSVLSFVVMGSPLGLLLMPGEGDLLLANRQITGVYNFRDDVDAVLQVEVDEIRRAVLNFVDGRLLESRALDVRESVVVEDRANEERLACRLPV